MQIPTGEGIRATRKKGLTQAELAERAGVSQPLIARIESNDVDPTIDTLYSVVAALNDSAADVEQEEVRRISMPSVLEEARKQTGHTQGELADAAGVSQPLISRIERWDVNPRGSTLRSLFDQLRSADSPDTEPSASPTSGSGLREKFEWDFENVQGSSEDSTANEDDQSGGQRRPECGSDLTSYPDPTYCPDCGAEV